MSDFEFSPSTVLVFIAGVFAASVAIRGFVLVRIAGFSDASPISDQVIGGAALLTGVLLTGISLVGVARGVGWWVFAASLAIGLVGLVQLVLMRSAPWRSAPPSVLAEVSSLSRWEVVGFVFGMLAFAARFFG